MAARNDLEVRGAMHVGSDPASSSASPSASDSTREQDLHVLDTALLPLARARWDERPTADDATQLHARPPDSETGLHVRDVPGESEPPGSGKITAETPGTPEWAPPPSTGGSNPEPTVATKPDPGITNLVPGTLVGEYVIERLLGAGAMGQVYGGRHEQLGKRVAIKVIAPSMARDRDAIERFAQEAIALARLAHPNVVAVLTVGTLPGDDRGYYVMEYLEGSSLQARLDRGRLALDEALDVVDQIARGLEAAHAAGIIHRDLKPDNIWLQSVSGEARPIVKLLDLGLAKLREHRRTEHTATNVMFGTPMFMSPEQCRSSRDVGPATDVYALGCVMFELLAGRLPFAYDNTPELIVAHQTEEVPRLRDFDLTITPELDALVVAMLAKDPARRPTLSTLRRALANFRQPATSSGADARSSPASAMRTPGHVVAAPAPAPRRMRWRWAVAATTTALLVLSFLIASVMMRRRGALHVEESIAPPGGAESRLAPQSTDGEVAQPSKNPIELARPGRDVAPLDAGIPASVVDASVAGTTTIDASAVAHESQTHAPPVEVKDSSPDRGPKPPADTRDAPARPRPPDGDRDPKRTETSSPDRNHDRDRTFNPFKPAQR